MAWGDGGVHLTLGVGDVLPERGSMSLVMKRGRGRGWQCLLRGQVGFLAAVEPGIVPHSSQELEV